MKKTRSKGVSVKDLELEKTYFFEGLADASEALGVSAQALYNAIGRSGVVKKRYRVSWCVRFYVVKTKGGDYRICRYEDGDARFVEVGSNGATVPGRSVDAVRDVTVCMLNDKVVGGKGWVNMKKEKEEVFLQ